MVKEKRQSKLFFLLKKKFNQKGVTLIEMIVVIFIFGLVSSVLLFNYSDFSSNVSVRNLAQDVGLYVRKAQTYSTSVQFIQNENGTEDFHSYGLSFSPDDNIADNLPYNRQFIFFADIPDQNNLPLVYNKMYQTNGSCGNPTENDECIQLLNINTADKIVSICRDVYGTRECMENGIVDITFLRPSPDANFCIKLGGYYDSCDTAPTSYVDLILQSAKGVQKTVTIWNTGQIAIN